ncbi:hypothetical protein [Soehngenia longivitae]|nr:hypothetical protein [Soehngenia longivitae]
MNNEEYYCLLDKRLRKLKELRESAKTIAAGIIGNTLYKEDLFFTSALDRSVALLDGIVNMLKERNLICVGILVRSQIDNCMRIFAAFIAEDKTAFMDGFIQGKKISDFKDNRGNKMKDIVLRKRLEDYDSQISDVYKKSSGYVHLSDVAFYSSVCAKDNYRIEFSVGLPIREEANEILIEGADAFIHYTLLQYQLLQAVVESKKRVDENSIL